MANEISGRRPGLEHDYCRVSGKLLTPSSRAACASGDAIAVTGTISPHTPDHSLK